MTNKAIQHLAPALAAAAVLLSGCAVHGYGDGTAVNFDRPDVVTLPDLTQLVDQMVRKLCANPAFRAKYATVAAATAPGALPALQVGNFENEVAQRSPSENVRTYTTKLETCRAKAREALQDKGLFALVDDAGAYGSDADTLNKGLEADIDAGLVAPDNIQRAGTYRPADFRMLGTLTRVSDGSRHYFVFQIRLYDLRTRDFWTSTQVLEKF